MGVHLHLLVVEDSSDDAQLVVRTIERGGYDVEYERVETEASLRAALEEDEWDLILCDYTLPSFNAVRALEIVKAAGKDLPFIIVSGSIGEDLAVAALRGGAHDFMLKGNLARLVPAIQRELHEAQVRRERKQAQAATRDAEARYRLLVERIPAITYVISGHAPFQTLYISPQVQAILGFTPEEWRADPDLWERQLHADDRERVLAEDVASRLGKRPFVAEYRIHARDGHVVWLHDETHHIDEPGLAPFSQGIEFDITERKQAEEAVRDADTRYRILVEQLPLIVYVNSPEEVAQTIYVSPQIEDVLGYSAQEWISEPTFWQTVIHPDDRQRVMARVEHAYRSHEPFDAEYRMKARDGHTVWFRDQAVPVKDESGRILQWQGLMVDVTQARQRQMEREAIARLSTALRQTQTLQEILPRMLDETLSIMDSGQGSIWLRASTSGNLYLAERRQHGPNPMAVFPHSQHLPALVIDSGQAIIQPNLREDPRLPPQERAGIPPEIGAACVPLSAVGKTFGALLINIRGPYELNAEDLRVLQALADFGASALHRALLFDETIKHLDRLAALRSIDIAISSSFDLRMILNVVIDNVLKELGVDAASILLLRSDSLLLDYAAGKGFWTRNIESGTLTVGQGLPGQAVLDRSVTFIHDLRAVPERIHRSFLLTEERFISYYGVPLVAKGKVKGVLEIFHRQPLAGDGEWMQFLEALAGQAAIAIDSSSIFLELQRSNMELALAYDATIEGWSHALDLRDRETEGHTLRVTEMALKLARLVGMDDEALIQVRRGGLLHDIGKMGVPDSVLLKPGKLDDEEWTIMRKHPQFAFDMLAAIPYLRPALDIPYCHHEHWDGNGYPRGLRAEQIPLAARVFAVVDVWDALRSDRPYRPAWAEDDVLHYLREERGRHFDSAIVDAFLELIAAESIHSSAD